MSVPRPAGTALLVLCLLALPAALGVALAADDGERDAPSAEGRVLSAGGSPLAGADVALYPCLDARAAAALALAGRAETPAVRGKTGADGRFVLAAPKPGVYVARIETKGTVPLTTAPLALVEPTALDDARLERDAGLVVAVADGAKPAAGATVRLRAEAARGPVPFWRPAEQWATTDAKGEARFALAARGAGRAAALLSGRGVAARDAVHGPRATLTVAAAPPTAVEVVATGDLPAANALLVDARLDLPLGFVGADGRGEARFAALGAAPRLRVVAADGATAETTFGAGGAQTTPGAGAKGRESQTTLAGGAPQTTLAGGASQTTPAGRESQTTPAGREPQTTRAGGRRRIVLAAPRVAQGRVVDAETRRPLAGAVAWRAGAEAEAATSDDAGAYKLVGAAPGDEILFRAAGALDADVRVRADGSLPTAALRGAAVVEGRVVAAGQPLAGVEVAA
ncbi:hypothetical protein LLG88_10925, partial [bacterium]|nr:hypothetical protein [bacterium]